MVSVGKLGGLLTFAETEDFIRCSEHLKLLADNRNSVVLSGSQHGRAFQIIHGRVTGASALVWQSPGAA